MRCFIGIDIGTSTTKCLLIAENGGIIHCSKLVNKYYIDDQGRVEFDAVERYESICTLIKITIRSLPEQFSVVAVTIVGASGNALLLNKNKYPISNAIGWQDERA